MNKICIFIGLFLITTCLQAQSIYEVEKDITLSGEIVNTEDGELIPYVHIINKNTSQGTTSDLDGKFKLHINKKDTLIFSAVGFNQYSLTLKENESGSDHYFLKIALNPSTYELAPVNIYAFKDEAGFKQDILNMRVPENRSPKIVIPGSYKGPRRDLSGNFSLGSPISAVQNLFSKEAKEIRKYQKVVKEYPRQKLIAEKYNREVVKKITGLEEDSKLNEFMLFCKIPEEYIINANEYEIIVAVNDCYKDFLASRN